MTSYIWLDYRLFSEAVPLMLCNLAEPSQTRLSEDGSHDQSYGLTFLPCYTFLTR